MSNQKEKYVLDSFALLAHFEKTNDWQKVLRLLERAANDEIILYMSLINVGEVYYILKRERGVGQAESMILDIDQLPIEKVIVDWEKIKIAASIKADYKIAYADAFAAGLAEKLGGHIVTGDPEFRQMEEEISVFWI